MKLFSRQLMHKHMCLNELSRETSYNLEKTNDELDQLISLQMFLIVAGLEERTTKVNSWKYNMITYIHFLSTQDLFDDIKINYKHTVILQVALFRSCYMSVVMPYYIRCFCSHFRSTLCTFSSF